MKPKSKILIIAGSDSSGGAGIQADIKTVTALGCYAMTAITAITAQNTTGVKSIIPIEPLAISKQIEFSAKDIRPNAVKVGMLHSKPVIKNVIKSLNKIKVKNKKIINSFKCKKAIKLGEKLIKNKGRLLVRPSGTEPKIRIMCETFNVSLMNKCINLIKKTIY